MRREELIHIQAPLRLFLFPAQNQHPPMGLFLWQRAVYFHAHHLMVSHSPCPLAQTAIISALFWQCSLWKLWLSYFQVSWIQILIGQLYPVGYFLYYSDTSSRLWLSEQRTEILSHCRRSMYSCHTCAEKTITSRFCKINRFQMICKASWYFCCINRAKIIVQFFNCIHQPLISSWRVVITKAWTSYELCPERL